MIEFNNPVLDELDGLSPQAKSALAMAHKTVAMSQPQPGVTAPGMTGGGPTTAPAPIAAPRKPLPSLGPSAPVSASPAASMGGIVAAKPASPLAQDQAELGRLRSTGSGISQIHNPWARIPLQIAQGIGAGFPIVRAMEMGLPGTDLHHDVLMRNAENAVKGDEALESEQAKNAETQALTGEANAKAEALRNPQPKEEASGKTITTDQGIMQWNPATQRYDIQAGKAPTKESTATAHVQDKEGNIWLLHPDGTATPVMGNGKQLTGNEPAAHVISPEQQYLNEYAKLHPGSTIAEAEKHYKADTQAPERPPQVMVMVPNAEGGATAQVLRPGQTVAPGTTTAAGFNQEQVAAQKSEKAEEKAREDAKKDLKLAQNLVAHPSPTNDLALVLHYIGAIKPESLSKLRLNQNEIKLVMGTRNTFGDLEALVNKVKNGQMLIPKQRQDMLDTMKILANGGAQDNGTGTVKYVANGRTYSIPVGQEKEFLKDFPNAKQQ